MRWAILLLAAIPAWSWWQVGHKAVAGVAYDQLSKIARIRVDSLLKMHPDYQKFIEGSPADETRRARFTFIQASYWPDAIKGDPRFYDESRRDAVATKLQPGFPDMKRRTNWHYINVGFSTDSTPVPHPPEPNFLTQIKGVLEAIGNDSPDAAYMLPWLLHLVGDIHQPMHCATRFRKGQVDPKTNKPWSDLGGNTVFLSNGMNLHAFWDSRLGETDTPEFVETMIQTLDKHAHEAMTVTDPEQWVREGFEIAKSVAYSFGNEGGTKENPVKLSDAYLVKAKEVAIARGGLAGHRLAAVLNQKLQ